MSFEPGLVESDRLVTNDIRTQLAATGATLWTQDAGGAAAPATITIGGTATTAVTVGGASTTLSTTGIVKAGTRLVSDDLRSSAGSVAATLWTADEANGAAPANISVGGAATTAMNLGGASTVVATTGTLRGGVIHTLQPTGGGFFSTASVAGWAQYPGILSMDSVLTSSSAQSLAVIQDYTDLRKLNAACADVTRWLLAGTTRLDNATVTTTSSIRIDEPAITLANGGTTITAATLIVGGAPTEGTTGNYGVLVQGAAVHSHFQGLMTRAVPISSWWYATPGYVTPNGLLTTPATVAWVLSSGVNPSVLYTSSGGGVLQVGALPNIGQLSSLLVKITINACFGSSAGPASTARFDIQVDPNTGTYATVPGGSTQRMLPGVTDDDVICFGCMTTVASLYNIRLLVSSTSNLSTYTFPFGSISIEQV